MNATSGEVASAPREAETTPEEADDPARERSDPTDDGRADPALRVRDLRKTYGSGDDAVTAVDGVSFDVERGSVVGLLGPNGAGKTTTIKSILGLIVPSGGTVRVNGVDVHDDTGRAYRHVGAMLEGARNVYWRLTVRENLEFFAALGGQHGDAVADRHDRLLEQFGLAGKADDPVNELSRGQKQKVSLAATLARGTDVVFLDEPTLGLDVEASLELRRELARLADEQDVTVVLSSHDMDVVEELCDRVVILSNGRVIADDAVEDLVGVLEAQAYRLVVEGDVPERARDRLDSRFQVDNWTSLADRTRLDVTLAEGRSLYDVFDVLRDAGGELLDVDGLEPDLEDVFLEVTDTGPGNDVTSTDPGDEDGTAAPGDEDGTAAPGGDRE